MLVLLRMGDLSEFSSIYLHIQRRGFWFSFHGMDELLESVTLGYHLMTVSMCGLAVVLTHLQELR